MAMYNSKYTEERAEKLLNLLRLGMPVKHACASVGIHRDTYYKWRKSSDSFDSRAMEAEGAVMARDLAVIETAARGTLKEDKDGKITGKLGDWRAAAWRLEKRFPKEFGHLARLQLDGEVKSTMDFTNLQLTQMASRLLERKNKKKAPAKKSTKKKPVKKTKKK